MGYYTSLIQRKFRDVVGSRYQTVMREYNQFLPSEEEMVVPDIRRILMPLDFFVQTIPDEYYEVLSAYDATVTLVYIIDAQTRALIAETLDEEAAAEFCKSKEEYGRTMLQQVSTRLASAGLTAESRLFIGDKADDVCKLSEGADLLALSRSYGGVHTDRNQLNPLTGIICQEAGIPALLY
ncbi:MAG: universal stress protein [Methanomicrobiales archaeon]